MMSVCSGGVLVFVCVTIAATSVAAGELISSTPVPPPHVANHTAWVLRFQPEDRESGFRNVLGAVLQFRSGKEEYEWPRLGWSVRLVLAAILGAVGASLSSVGGVGGGGLYVPLTNLLLGFDTKTAAALSNFMILGGSLSNMGFNLQQAHPEIEGQPLIDFDAALMLEPNMLLGISLGVICNVMFPAWVITVLLAVSLLYMTIRSLSGGMRRWATESRRMEAAEEDRRVQFLCVQKPGQGGGDLHTPLLVSSTPNSQDWNCKEIDDNLGLKNKALSLTIQDTDVINLDNGDHALEIQSLTTSKLSVKIDTPEVGTSNGVLLQDQYPLKKVGILALVWFIFLGVQVLRGGKGKSLLQLRPCGIGYWLFTASQIPIALAFTRWAAHTTSQETSSNHDQDGRLTFAERARSVLPVMAFLAGLLGGMLGLGGGMIISPLLLDMGMPPQVTAATCAFMVFFSSSMSVVQYWLLGRIPMTYALLLGGICLLFSGVGQIIVKRVIVQYGRASIIVFSVSAVIGLSAIVMAGFGGYEIVQAYLRGEYMGFHRPC